MIEKLIIDNFKLHKHTELGMSGLTVLTGVNGMGKSSVVQALLLLRQSFMSSDLATGLNLKGDLCNIGSAGELACQTSDSDMLKLTINDSNGKKSEWEFLYPEDINETFLSRKDNNENNVSLSLFTNDFQYIGAFRFGPQKSYGRDTSIVKTRRQISKEMGQCEYAVNFLFQYQKDDIAIKELALPNDDGSFSYDLGSQVDLWMRQISPNIQVKIESQQQDFMLKYKFFRDQNTMTDDVSAMNTGFGITYVLPILVAMLSSKKDSLIIIENPEAHIHPTGQSVLMDLITRAVGHGVQVVLETHSDHILNGGLVAIHQGKVNTSDVSVYFFERNEADHVAVPVLLRISDKGHIKRPPKGFFDQFTKDLHLLMDI